MVVAGRLPSSTPLSSTNLTARSTRGRRYQRKTACLGVLDPDLLKNRSDHGLSLLRLAGIEDLTEVSECVNKSFNHSVEIRGSMRLRPGPGKLPSKRAFTLDLRKPDSDGRDIIRTSSKGINQTIDLLAALSEFGFQ